MKRDGTYQRRGLGSCDGAAAVVAAAAVLAVNEDLWSGLVDGDRRSDGKERVHGRVVR